MATVCYGSTHRPLEAAETLGFTRRYERDTPMDFRRFLGGHPMAVAVRLALLSILVGVLLSVFGITPRNFFRVLDEFARSIYDLGFGAFRWIVDYLLLGAMVVVPIWLVRRLLKSGDNKL